MARSNDLDIRATADQISALFNANRSAEALAMLNERRQEQSEVVRDALDRYVGAASAGAVANQQQGPVAATDASALQRLQQAASSQPVIPAQTQMAALSDAQRYDVYASIVQVRGNDAAHDALSRPNERVVLGLRQENSTLAAMQNRDNAGSLRSDDPATPAINEAQGGTGVYNDRLVVLWKDADGTRHTQVAQQANTEPTAQYDHHAGNTGRRPLAEGGIENRTFAPSPGFESITRPRKIEGEDVNADGIRDLGRLSEGTIEMRMGQHPNPSRPGTKTMRCAQVRRRWMLGGEECSGTAMQTGGLIKLMSMGCKISTTLSRSIAALVAVPIRQAARQFIQPSTMGSSRRFKATPRRRAGNTC